MKKLTLVLGLFSALAQAQVSPSNVIQFRGQNGDAAQINQVLQGQREEEVYVPQTCTREVPREVQECGNVSRERYECSPGPSREVCVDVPQRQVCVERPTREVCRTDSRGQQRCQTVGGGQSCHWVGGGRECRTERGEDVCRTVRDTEYVCQTVTRYESEEYECGRTETRTVATQIPLQGRVNVVFVTNGIVEEFPIQINLEEKMNNGQPELLIVPVLLRQPRVIVAAQKRRVRVIQDSPEGITVEGDMTIELLDVSNYPVTLPTALKLATISKEMKVSMNVEGMIGPTGRLELELLSTAGPKLGEFKGLYPSDRAKLVGNKLEIDLKGLVQQLAPSMVINVKVGADVIRGEILNADRSKIEKLFNRLVIKQQN